VKDALVLEVPVSLPCLSALCSATLCLPLSDWDPAGTFLGATRSAADWLWVLRSTQLKGRTGTLVAYLKEISNV
jgi:hypothetical protein